MRSNSSHGGGRITKRSWNNRSSNSSNTMSSISSRAQSTTAPNTATTGAPSARGSSRTRQSSPESKGRQTSPPFRREQQQQQRMRPSHPSYNDRRREGGGRDGRDTTNNNLRRFSNPQQQQNIRNGGERRRGPSPQGERRNSNSNRRGGSAGADSVNSAAQRLGERFVSSSSQEREEKCRDSMGNNTIEAQEPQQQQQPKLTVAVAIATSHHQPPSVTDASTVSGGGLTPDTYGESSSSLASLSGDHPSTMLTTTAAVNKAAAIPKHIQAASTTTSLLSINTAHQQHDNNDETSRTLTPTFGISSCSLGDHPTAAAAALKGEKTAKATAAKTAATTAAGYGGISLLPTTTLVRRTSSSNSPMPKKKMLKMRAQEEAKERLEKGLLRLPSPPLSPTKESLLLLSNNKKAARTGTSDNINNVSLTPRLQPQEEKEPTTAPEKKSSEPKDDTAVASPASSASSAPSTTTSTNPDVSHVRVGTRVAVYWDGEDEYFKGTVTKERPDRKKNFYLEYDDGDTEWINFEKCTWRLVRKKKKKNKKQQQQQQQQELDADKSTEPSSPSSKAAKEHEAKTQSPPPRVAKQDDSDSIAVKSVLAKEEDTRRSETPSPKSKFKRLSKMNSSSSPTSEKSVSRKSAKELPPAPPLFSPTDLRNSRIGRVLKKKQANEPLPDIETSRRKDPIKEKKSPVVLQPAKALVRTEEPVEKSSDVLTSDEPSPQLASKPKLKRLSKKKSSSSPQPVIIYSVNDQTPSAEEPASRSNSPMEQSAFYPPNEKRPESASIINPALKKRKSLPDDSSNEPQEAERSEETNPNHATENKRPKKKARRNADGLVKSGASPLLIADEPRRSDSASDASSRETEDLSQRLEEPQSEPDGQSQKVQLLPQDAPQLEIPVNELPKKKSPSHKERVESSNELSLQKEAAPSMLSIDRKDTANQEQPPSPVESIVNKIVEAPLRSREEELAAESLKDDQARWEAFEFDSSMMQDDNWVAAACADKDSSDSDTDEEEIFSFAANMFGLGESASSLLKKKRKKKRKERKARKERELALLATDREDLGHPENDFGIPAHLLVDVHIPISEKVKMGRRKRAPPSPSAAGMDDTETKPSPPVKKVKLRASSAPASSCRDGCLSPPSKKAKLGPSVTVARKDSAEKRKLADEDIKRKKEEKRTLTPAEISAILGEDHIPCSMAAADNWVRRSSRMPSKSSLESPKVKALLQNLKANDPDMVVLKLKKYICDPAAPSLLIDAALDALEENTNCEALYIQNFNEGMRDAQVKHLIRILQHPKCNIWCLNIGETYKVKRKTWSHFVKGLKKTKITHMYASEHTITTEMKDKIRETIRNNRSKHNMHCDPNNLDTIVRCTHCWWNPINTKSLRPHLRSKGYEYILTDKEAQGLQGSISGATLGEGAITSTSL